jgi:hypothetical protein
LRRVSADIDGQSTPKVGIDIPAALAARGDLRENVATCRALTHNSGIVDQRYLDQVHTSPLQIGQRIVVSQSRSRFAECGGSTG